MQKMLLCLLAGFYGISLPAQSLFSKTFSDSDTTSQQTFQLTPVSGTNSFLLVKSEGRVPQNAAAEILYLDSAADLKWAKRFTSPDSSANNPNFTDLKPTVDGWLLAGSYSNNATLLKLDTGFNLMWAKGFILDHVSGSFPAIRFLKILSTDEKFIITGTYGSGKGEDNRDSILLLSLNKDGSNPQMSYVEFYKNAGQSSKIKIDTPVTVFQNKQNQYLFFTSSGTLNPETFPGEAASPEVTLLDSSFHFLSAKKWILNYSANLVSCIRLNSGDYLLLGNGYKNLYLMELDSSLNVNWLKTYNQEVIADSNDYILASSVVQTENGFNVAGAKYFRSASSQAAWMMRTDNEGNLLESNLIGVDSASAGAIDNLLSQPENFVLMASETPPGLNGSNNLLLMNSDANGNISCSLQNEPLIVFSDSLKDIQADTPSVGMVNDYTIESVKLNSSAVSFTASDNCVATSTNDVNRKDHEVKIYPQPAAETVSIFIPAFEAGNSGTISVYNSVGELIQSGKVQAGYTSFSVKNLASGIYLVKIQFGQKSLYSKLIVQNH